MAETEDALAAAGRRVFERLAGRGLRPPEEDESSAMASAYATNSPYMMAAEQWERDGWVQGAARYLQQQDLADIDAERRSTERRIGRLAASLDPVEAARQLHAEATAAAEKAQWETEAANRRAMLEAASPPVRQSGPATFDSMVDAKMYRDDVGNPIGGARGDGIAEWWAANEARLAGEAAGRDVIEREAAGYQRRMNTVYGDPMPVVDPATGEVVEQLFVPMSGREGGRIRDLQGDLGDLGNEALLAQLDVNRYAREAAPYLGVHPMLAEGLYPSDPRDQVRMFTAEQQLANLGAGLDLEGLSPVERQMRSYVDSSELRGDFSQARDRDLLAASPEAALLEQATGLDPDTVVSAMSTPLWADYSSEVERVATDMPDATWADVKSEMDLMGLPLPSGDTEEVLAAYFRKRAGYGEGG